jgi:MacB-like periplasmic core domain
MRRSAFTSTCASKSISWAVRRPMRRAGAPSGSSGTSSTFADRRLLGVTPLLGRAFRTDEELPASERVVMLSEPFWRRRFASDPGVLGRVLTLNGQPFTVIGIFPSTARARLPNELLNGRRTDYWAPLRLTDQSAPRGLHFMYAMGQLRPGDLAQARLRLAAMSTALEKDGVSMHKVQASPTYPVVRRRSS